MCITEPDTVFIVDPDEVDCQRTRELLASVGFDARGFSGATEALDAARCESPACVILEMLLPGMSGPDLHVQLNRLRKPPTVIFLSAQGDVPAAVRAMRDGALDFLQKPSRQQVILQRVYDACQRYRKRCIELAHSSTIVDRAARLTAREREVMTHVVAGLPNKAIAVQLGVTRKAIEAYRARVMRKMEAENLPDLVRMSLVLRTGDGVSDNAPRRTVSPGRGPGPSGPPLHAAPACLAG